MRGKKPLKRRDQDKKVPNFFRLIFYFLSLSFLGVAVYVLFFSPFLKINRIALEGIQELEYQDVLDDINSFLKGRYFGVIPRNNIILVSPKIIGKHLTGRFKKIRQAEIKKIFPDALEIKIQERKSLLVLCSGGPCYIVDEKGYAFNGVDLESSQVKENNLIKIVDLNAKLVDLEQKVLDESYVRFALDLKDKLAKDAGIEIFDEGYTNPRISGDIQVKTREGWDIYFNTAAPLDKSIKNLKIFLEENKNFRENNKLEYIDLRVKNKIYYKIKQEEKKEGEEAPTE